MATTDENNSMNLVAMETESSQFNPGNKLLLVAGLSCIIAGIVKLVQCGRQNQDDGNSENATAHGYERARIGLRFLTTGLSLIWKARRVEFVLENMEFWHPIPLLIIFIICEILFIMFPIIVVNFINGSAQELNPFTH